MSARATFENTCLAIGAIGLTIFAGDLIYRKASASAALAEFDRDRAAAEEPAAVAELSLPGTPDFSLWSEKRARAYQASLVAKKDKPFAVVEVPKAHIRVPVYGGTDESALDRGAGWIEGTARPGEGGNIGIAAHRDGFFRGLKDVEVGDTVALSTVRYTSNYTVDEIRIVTPSDTSVLHRGAAPALTLVTCYPFYFVGDAPRRYIVHAVTGGAAMESARRR